MIMMIIGTVARRMNKICSRVTGFSANQFSIQSRNFVQSREGGQVSLHEIRNQFKELTGGSIKLRKDDTSGIAYITIDHVEKKNSISGKMMVELNDAVSSLETWEHGKGVILSGAGNNFCSGAYLDTVKAICTPEGGLRMATLMHDSTTRLRNLPIVSVTLIAGKTIGGGAELAFATDYRLMSPSSEIRFVEAKMGTGTGWGGGTHLQRIVGHRAALDLLLTCRKVSSEEAMVLGLADGIVEVKEGDQDDALLRRATEWLQTKIGPYHPSVVQTVKGIVNCDNFEEERRIFAKTFGGVAQQEALSKNIKHK